MESAVETNVEKQVTLYKFTNKEESPQLDNILAMFYTGVNDNTIGIMESWDLENEREALILVGIEVDENGKPVCFPLAQILRAEDVGSFLSPDGKGGYFDMFDPSEAAAAREEMKTVVEATTEVVEAE